MDYVIGALVGLFTMVAVVVSAALWGALVKNWQSIEGNSSKPLLWPRNGIWGGE